VFISYVHQNNAEVDRLCRVLEGASAGGGTCFAVNGFRPGQVGGFLILDGVAAPFFGARHYVGLGRHAQGSFAVR
jgi:hypothetical protein